MFFDFYTWKVGFSPDSTGFYCLDWVGACAMVGLRTKVGKKFKEGLPWPQSRR